MKIVIVNKIGQALNLVALALDKSTENPDDPPFKNLLAASKVSDGAHRDAYYSEQL